MLLGIGILEREQSEFTTDNKFFNKKVLLFFLSFQLIKRQLIALVMPQVTSY